MPASASTLQSNLNLSLTGTLQKIFTTLSTAQDPLSKLFKDAMATGTGVQQADTLFHDTRTLSNTSETLSLAAGPSIPNPTLGPTLSVGSTGGLAAGNWSVAFTYTTARGETLPSPTTTINASSGQVVTAAAVTPLPTGVTGVNWYLSQAANSATLLRATSNVGGSTNFAVAGSGAAVPSSSTAQGTVLYDPFGNPITMGHLKVLYVGNNAPNAGDFMYVGNAGANPVVFGLDSGTARRKLDAGDCLLHWQPKTGSAVVLNTSDQLKFDATGAPDPVTYDIVLIGTST
jgi:hypothetical protein